ncbi:hypothetical protein PInf_013649 [Phytophthora infestans]|nr:hypothetical protein PInf_013649 [Phytophthora infestans]
MLQLRPSPRRAPSAKASEDSATRSPAKKRRSSGKGKKVACAPAEDFSELLESSAKASVPVRKAILVALSKAVDVGKKPWCLAFPWSSRTLFYDPKQYRHVIRAPWRFWMVNRRAFWGWAFHTPLEPGTAQSNRRKLKMRAIQDQFAFTSSCIKTWGLYAFMEKLDKHPETFLLEPREFKHHTRTRGQSGRFSREARKYDEPVSANLAVLRNKGRKKLSIAALTRIRKDIMSSVLPKHTWVGDRGIDPWKAIVNSYKVKQVQYLITAQIIEGSYELPCVSAPTRAEVEREDWSDFEDGKEDGDAANPPVFADDKKAPEKEEEEEVSGDDDAEDDAGYADDKESSSK